MFLFLILVAGFLQCLLKLYIVLWMTPRTFGFFTNGAGFPSMVINAVVFPLLLLRW
jgi:hypothetical protein